MVLKKLLMSGVDIAFILKSNGHRVSWGRRQPTPIHLTNYIISVIGLVFMEVKNDVSEFAERKLGLRLRKKYARAQNVFRLGIYGKNVDCLYYVVLTTYSEAVIVESHGTDRVGESRNSYKQVLIDNRHLRHRMKQEGFIYDDCLCCELSPKGQLVHLHGFYRFAKPLKEMGKKEGDFREALSRNWGVIHQSPIIYADKIMSLKGAINYNLKDAVKNFVSEQFIGNRILVTKGWLPSGWKTVQRWLVRWALSVTDVVVDSEGWGSDGQWYPNSLNKEYIFDKWAVVQDEMKRWCEGYTVEVKIDGKWFMAWLDNGEAKILEGEIASD